MSKQLALSAGASIFAMVASVLVATHTPNAAARNEAGASAHASAPAGWEAVANLSPTSLPLITR
ncbi:MAG: hypothetical protein ABIT10_12330 [Alteraurantiacibacter sp.]